MSVALSWERAFMEEPDVQTPPGSAEIEANVMESFVKSFQEVQTIFDQNTALISEINRNHGENAAHGGLLRNVDLIWELNNNMGQVVQLYASMSAEFMKSMQEDNKNPAGGENTAVALASHEQSPNAELAKGPNKEQT